MMADEEEKGNASKGNDWEVVSLTASAYAASLGPHKVDSTEDENLALDTELVEIHNEKGIEDDVSELFKEGIVKSDTVYEENVTFEGLMMPDEFPGIPIFDDKGDLSSATGKLDNVEEGEGTDDSVDTDSGLGLRDSEKCVEGDECDSVDLPCEAWWKRRAVTFYVHAKEANTFWSVFIAAAVMGIVIIGHQWQHDRWKALHLKWQIGVTGEKTGRMMGPISRFKDAIVGGHRRDPLVKG